VTPTTAGAEGGGAPRFDASNASIVGEEAAAIGVGVTIVMDRALSTTVELTTSATRVAPRARVEDRFK
jgi:hypothetical protein